MKDAIDELSGLIDEVADARRRNDIQSLRRARNMNNVELIDKEWLEICPVCDACIPGRCVCNKNDPRNVISNLLHEIEVSRRIISELCKELDRHRLV